MKKHFKEKKMREIEFRGKRKSPDDQNEWVYGTLAIGKSGRRYIARQESEKESFEFIEVIPETIGQYTSYKDKTGKKIFEADLMTRDDGKKGIVHWGFWELMLTGFYCWSIGPRAIGVYKDELIAREYEVIGNIHDNPELMKGGI